MPLGHLKLKLSYCLNIPMYESQRIRSNIFHVMAFSGKHRILDGIPRNLFKTFENGSKLFQTANR